VAHPSKLVLPRLTGLAVPTRRPPVRLCAGGERRVLISHARLEITDGMLICLD
jgi:hypothetical protein